jgi:hypothetical protein
MADRVRIDGGEAHLLIRAEPELTRRFELRTSGLDSEAAEAVRSRVVDLVQAWNNSPRATEIRHESEEDGGKGDGGNGDGPIRVGLMGPADPADRRDLERQVRAIVAEETRGDRAASAGCVCYGYLPAQELRVRPEESSWYDSAGVWQPELNGRPDWLVAVFLDVQGWNAAALHVWDGSALSPPVPRNQVLLGLANGTSWPKEIWADNLCSGRVASVYQETTNPIFRRMLLDAPDCYAGVDTVVFRKPGLFGIWHEVCHFEPNDFWRAFGGTRCDFVWVKDF